MFRFKLLDCNLYVTLTQKDSGEYANNDGRDAHNDGQSRRPADQVVRKSVVLHDPEEPRRDQVGQLAHEALHRHDPRAFMVVRGEFVAQGHPGRRKDRVSQVEHQ